MHYIRDLGRILCAAVREGIAAQKSEDSSDGSTNA
jgi:hypothetical protein